LRRSSTQSAAEYWHRSGSLVTLTRWAGGSQIPATCASTPSAAPARSGGRPAAARRRENLNNPATNRPFLRALLDGLDGWVRKGTLRRRASARASTASRWVDWKQASTGFPALVGVRYPQVIQRPPMRDYGPEFLSKGIIHVEPPRVVGEYTVLCRSATDGNDLGTLLPPEVACRWRTYTGWNLRRKDVAPRTSLPVCSARTSPFAKTRDERKKKRRPAQVDRGTLPSLRGRTTRSSPQPASGVAEAAPAPGRCAAARRGA